MAKFKKLTKDQIMWTLFTYKWALFFFSIIALVSRNIYIGNASLVLFIALSLAITFRKKEDFLAFDMGFYNTSSNDTEEEGPSEKFIQLAIRIIRKVIFFSFSILFLMHCAISLMVLETTNLFTVHLAREINAIESSAFQMLFKMAIAGLAVGLPAFIVYSIGYLIRYVQAKQFRKQRIPFISRA